MTEEIKKHQAIPRNGTEYRILSTRFRNKCKQGKRIAQCRDRKNEHHRCSRHE